jgi:hypothetical protein
MSAGLRAVGGQGDLFFLLFIVFMFFFFSLYLLLLRLRLRLFSLLPPSLPPYLFLIYFPFSSFPKCQNKKKNYLRFAAGNMRCFSELFAESSVCRFDTLFSGFSLSLCSM